jgi:hypothetical protein
MPWVYLDDHIDEHDKTIEAGDAAFGFWVRLVAFCRRKQNGGRIPKTLDRLKGERAKVKRLVDVNYLEDHGDHYQVHDYDAIYFKEDAERQRRSDKAKRAADARWDAQRNAQADAQAMPEQCSGDATHADVQAPDPTPHTPVEPSSSSGTVVGAPLDDNELLAQTWRVLAVRRLSKREAEKGSVGSREAWLTSVIAGMPATHGDEANALLASEDGWTPELLADALEPPPRSAPTKPPDPMESTAAAAAELRRRQQLPPCETCDSVRQVELESGAWAPCPDCSVRASA